MSIFFNWVAAPNSGVITYKETSEWSIIPYQIAQFQKFQDDDIVLSRFYHLNRIGTYLCRLDWR
jgi:hypothetical protein